MGKLSGKVAIVTGSTRGIGRETAKMMADEGAKVVVCGRSAALGEAVVQDIARSGGEAAFLGVDLSNMDSVRAMFSSAIDTFGTVDVLVNCAAADDPMDARGLQDIDEELYDRVMTVNVKAPFELCRLAIPYMEKSGEGSIVNVGSIASTGAGRGPIVYTVSKHALLGLTREIEFCHGRNGVRANCVLPGGVYTELTKNDFDNPDHPLSRAIAMSPAGRPARPEELASIIVFLCTRESWFMQGSAVVADGGGTLC